MSVLQDFHPKVKAVRIDDLDGACRAINANRRPDETHVWNDSTRIVISRRDGSFATAGRGDWIVVRLFDGAVFPLSNESFTADYQIAA